MQEVEECLAEAAVCLEDHGGDWVGVVFAALVEFTEGAGVAGGDSDVRGTRQSSSSGGGGNHNVHVDRFGGGEKSDVGTIEVGGVLYR